jgi:hypothetical protein
MQKNAKKNVKNMKNMKIYENKNGIHKYLLFIFD